MNLTIRMLARMPEFSPVREAIVRIAEARGREEARAYLNGERGPITEPVICEWLLGATDAETADFRTWAMLLVLDDTES